MGDVGGSRAGLACGAVRIASGIASDAVEGEDLDWTDIAYDAVATAGCAVLATGLVTGLVCFGVTYSLPIVADAVVGLGNLIFGGGDDDDPPDDPPLDEPETSIELRPIEPGVVEVVPPNSGDDESGDESATPGNNGNSQNATPQRPCRPGSHGTCRPTRPGLFSSFFSNPWTQQRPPSNRPRENA